MNHRRDFLRENKLSLRELQKNTSQKLIQQQQDHDSRQYKHIQKFHKTQEQAVAVRSASQSRNSEQNSRRQSRITIRDGQNVSVATNNGGGDADADMREKSNYLAGRRAYSQQRHKVENLPQPSTCCCIRHHQQQQQQQKPQHSDTQHRERIPTRSISSVSVLSKAESCDKEIQTEDINDEHFLYEALKKCSFTELPQQPKHKSNEQLNTKVSYHQQQHPHSNYNLQECEAELKSIYDRKAAAYVPQCHYEDDNKSQHGQIVQNTSRCHTQTHQDIEIENDVNEDLEQHFRNSKVVNDMKREPEPPTSARSRQSLCSTSTKRSVHKLGDREDVRLPRYLEKEKREKEEERLRELSKDLNCPFDHYVLNEEERIKALTGAQQKMASLINELNHMPMTMETLRIRKRKVEIEKELTQIEFDIRLYSKPKVYMPKTQTSILHS